jgi:dipeptidyl aminopeptidase/acylaminoacyl peptidase
MCLKVENKLFAVVLLVLLAGAQTWPETLFSSPSQSHQAKQYTIEQFLDITHYRGNSFSTDGSKILLSSDQTGVDNAFAIQVNGGGAAQLTGSTDTPIQVQSYFPHDDRFLYLADHEGNEMDQLYVREQDGSSIDLTSGKDHQVRFLGWAQDGLSLFLSTNERDPRFFDIYEIQVDGYERSLLFEDRHGYEFQQISPDKRLLSFIRTNKREDTDILLYDRQTQIIRNLTPDPGDIEYRHQAFSADSQSIFYTSNQNTNFAYLVRENLKTGQKKVVLKTDWDISFAKLSRQGRYLTIGINKDATTELTILDGNSLKLVTTPPLPKGDITSVSFSRDENMIAFYASTNRSPHNLFLLDLSKMRVRQLTSALSPAIDSNDLVEAETVRFASFDGMQIPGLLFKPRGASAEHKVPALVWVHGGPGGQARNEFNPLIQYLVNHGYAVYAINNRGSSGYGKDFFTADDRKHGQADLDDCVASKSMLIATGYIDPERIGIIGKSYGGYLTLAAMTFRPEEFTVGVNLFGISDWIHTLKNMPAWWESLRQALYTEIGHPEKDKDYLKSISPRFHAENIVNPVMVLQGSNDPRVSKSSSDLMVAALEHNGTPVEYLVFEDEGHRLSKKGNRLRAYESIRSFLDQYLMEHQSTANELAKQSKKY